MSNDDNSLLRMRQFINIGKRVARVGGSVMEDFVVREMKTIDLGDGDDLPPTILPSSEA